MVSGIKFFFYIWKQGIRWLEKAEVSIFSLNVFMDGYYWSWGLESFLHNFLVWVDMGFVGDWPVKVQNKRIFLSRENSLLWS